MDGARVRARWWANCSPMERGSCDAGGHGQTLPSQPHDRSCPSRGRRTPRGSGVTTPDTRAAVHEPWWLSIREVGAAYRRGGLSPVDLTQALLDRIASFDPAVGTFLTVTGREALRAAAGARDELRSGMDRGPLHGIPIGLKDLIDTAGVRTTAGSRLLANRVPRRDATVVRRLRAAGAVVLGKQAMTEFATGAFRNPTFGATHNPWRLDRVAGGSSAGSAASVAAALALGAIGTDTGGSIRGPAALCGVVGLRPTRGLVPQGGIFPLAPSFDVVGPIARTVDGVRLLHEAMTGLGSDGLRASERPIDGLRVGVLVGEPWARLAPAAAEAVERVTAHLARGGARIVPLVVPGVADAVIARRTVQYAEAAVVHAPWAERRADYDPEVLALLDAGRRLRVEDVAAARQRLRAFRRGVARQLGGLDLVLAATVPCGAWPIDAATTADGEPAKVAAIRLTAPITAAGLTAVSLPAGFDGDGLPVAVQLAGLPGSDALLLTVAEELEGALGVVDRRPPGVG